MSKQGYAEPVPKQLILLNEIEFREPCQMLTSFGKQLARSFIEK